MPDKPELTPAEQHRAQQLAAWRKAITRAAADKRNQRSRRAPKPITGYLKPPPP